MLDGDRLKVAGSLIGELLEATPAERRRRLDGVADAVVRDYVERALTVVPAPETSLASPQSAQTPGSPADQTAQRPEGMIAHYRLLGELGRGGQGVVHLAEDTRLGRRVALKLLPRLLGSTASLRRFEREAALASRLDHPAIATVFESGVADGVRFIAMRHIAGEPLDAKIRRAREEGKSAETTVDLRAVESSGAPPSARARLDRLLAFVEAAARALHVAHEAGLVHRDVKPGNIMVGADSLPVILDFGLAADRDDGAETLTRTGDVMGTPAYMAPEQIASSAAVDRRADVYSLGAVLFEALTLVRPFDGPTHQAIFDAIRRGATPSVRAFRPHLSRDLDVIVRTAMAPEPRLRYATAAAFADDLGLLRAGRPIRAKPPNVFGRVVRWARREKMRAAFLGFAIVALPTIGGLYLSNARGRAALEAEDQRLAAVRCDEAVTNGFHNLGESRPAAALADFEAAARLLPEDETAFCGRVLALVYGKRFDEAMRLIDAAPRRLADTYAIATLRAAAVKESAPGAESAPTARLPERAIDHYVAGARAMRLGHLGDRKAFREALRSLRIAAALAPRPAQVFFVEAMHAAGHAGDPDLVRDMASVARRLWPESVATQRMIGSALSYCGQDVEALEAFRYVARIAPDDGDVLVATAAALSRLGRHDEALANYERALKVYPSPALVHGSIGVTLAQMGRFADAVAAADRALALDPDDLNAWKARAGSLTRLGRAPEAVAAVRRLTELETWNAAFWTDRAEMEFGVGDFAASLASAERARELDPSVQRSQWLAGQSLQKLKRDDEAIRVLEAARRSAPLPLIAESSLLVAQLRRRQFEPALSTIDRILGIDPNVATVWYNKAAALQALDRKDESIEPLKRAVALDPGNVGYRRTLAMYLASLGRGREVIGDLRQVFEADPKDARLGAQLLRALRELGEDEEGSRVAARVAAADLARAAAATENAERTAALDSAESLIGEALRLLGLFAEDDPTAAAKTATALRELLDSPVGAPLVDGSLARKALDADRSKRWERLGARLRAALEALP